MRLLFILLVFISSLFAENKQFDIYKEAVKKSDIPYQLLHTIAKHESTLNKYAIGLVYRNSRIMDLMVEHLKHKEVKYKRRGSHLGIYPDNLDTAFYILQFISKVGVRNYDIGLMQINSANIRKWKLNKMRLLSDRRYSLKIGQTVLKTCFDIFPYDVELAIECYNKGTNKKKLQRLKRNGKLNYYRMIASLYTKEHFQ